MLFKSFQLLQFLKKYQLSHTIDSHVTLWKRLSAMFRRKNFSSFSSIQFLPKIHQMRFCLPEGNHFLQLCQWQQFTMDWNGQGSERMCHRDIPLKKHFCMPRDTAVEAEKKVKLNTWFLSEITKLKFGYINFMGLFWNFSS